MDSHLLPRSSMPNPGSRNDRTHPIGFGVWFTLIVPIFKDFVFKDLSIRMIFPHLSGEGC